MLIEAADDPFNRVVGRWDQVGADAVGQSGPMALQEVENSHGRGAGLDVFLAEG